MGTEFLAIVTITPSSSHCWNEGSSPLAAGVLLASARGLADADGISDGVMEEDAIAEGDGVTD